MYRIGYGLPNKLTRVKITPITSTKVRFTPIFIFNQTPHKVLLNTLYYANTYPFFINITY